MLKAIMLSSLSLLNDYNLSTCCRMSGNIFLQMLSQAQEVINSTRNVLIMHVLYAFTLKNGIENCNYSKQNVFLSRNAFILNVLLKLVQLNVI